MAALVLLTTLLIIGIARKIRCLIILWSSVYAVLQILILGGILFCIFYMPANQKFWLIFVGLLEAFVLFPWWFLAVQLLAVSTNDRDKIYCEDPDLLSSAPSSYFFTNFDHSGSRSEILTQNSYRPYHHHHHHAKHARAHGPLLQNESSKQRSNGPASVRNEKQSNGIKGSNHRSRMRSDPNEQHRIHCSCSCGNFHENKFPDRNK